ncbi:MAG: substrate-binding domain-containing protein [Kiritimatiellae bacterium]|nr:substrate-binding domain-containing protein [Kiritimatiellia bacterium]
MADLLDRFTYKPDGATTHADALCSFIKKEISAGRLKAGAPLPTIKALSEASGLTFRQARGVMERLAHEKYVRSRPRVGAVVLQRGARSLHGRVVLALPDVDVSSYHATQLADALRRRLTREGYAFTTVVFSRNARRRQPFPEAEFADAPDLAIAMYATPRVRAFLRETGERRLFLYGGEPAEDDGPWIRFSAESAIERFAAHCVRSGVRRVKQVRLEGGETPDAAPALSAAGMECGWMNIPRRNAPGRYEDIERSACETFLELPEETLPDVFLFWDDFAARGALTALLKRGMDIPGDVKVATLSNSGMGPVYAEPLTRIECDAAAAGEKVANYALALLAKGRVPPPPAITPQYVFGATFPY